MAAAAAEVSSVSTLVQMCIKRVAECMELLENKVCDLPASLLKDLMLHLDIIHLDRVEHTACLKGVSSSFAWEAKWKDLDQTWRWKLKLMGPIRDWKQKCLERLFHMVLFRKAQVPKSFTAFSDDVVLSVSARHVQHLSVATGAREIRRLAVKRLSPVLSILEQGVTSIVLAHAQSFITPKHTPILFVLHRLLDHGSVKEVVLKNTPPCFAFEWITSRCRGSSSVDPYPLGIGDDSCDEDLWERDGPSAPKRQHLDTCMDKQTFLRCCNVNRRCPAGQIHSLDVEIRLPGAVSSYLSSWLCLRSLHVNTVRDCSNLLWDMEADGLVESLRKLFLNPLCSLKELSISSLYLQGLLSKLLAACPTLHSLSLEIGTLKGVRVMQAPNLLFAPNTKLPLEMLSVKSTESQIIVEGLPDVLQYTPNLRSLHVMGILQTQSLLCSLPEFCPLLKVLVLNRVSLVDCREDIIHLLKTFSLEELSLVDCRLLEICTEKKDFLLRFVAAVREQNSLQTLSLSEIRLAKNVTEIADLFSGDAPSSITTLDLSSNFILPADLLEFSQKLESYRPAQRITLNLRRNPLDRDPKIKAQALGTLHKFCNVLTDDWNSMSAMADYVSVM